MSTMHSNLKVSPKRLDRVTRMLLEYRDEDSMGWSWLSECKGRSLDKRSANKFLLACILDYQMPSEKAWDNARRLAEEILGDPKNLWETITACTEAEWEAKRPVYKIHRFPQAHTRVWRIGKAIVEDYEGDVRLIWKKQPAAVVQDRLEQLRVGEQLSRMIVGALNDTGFLNDPGDVKADIHVRRVLGRLLAGRMLGESEATDLTRQMSPSNPWLLDKPLFWIGKDLCHAQDPDCSYCDMHRICTYRRGRFGHF